MSINDLRAQDARKMLACFAHTHSFMNMCRRMKRACFIFAHYRLYTIPEILFTVHVRGWDTVEVYWRKYPVFMCAANACAYTCNLCLFDVMRSVRVTTRRRHFEINTFIVCVQVSPSSCLVSAFGVGFGHISLAAAAAATLLLQPASKAIRRTGRAH